MGVLVAVAAHASDYSFDVKVTGMGTPIIMIPGLTSHADVYKDVTLSPQMTVQSSTYPDDKPPALRRL